MELFLGGHALFLLAAGFVLGIFAVVFGGGMFFSIPMMQWLFPEVSFGVIVGNIKVGSFFRSIGSTISTHKQIEYRENLKVGALAFVGAAIGTSVIANLDQRWLFPAIVFAIAFALGAPKIAPKINGRMFHLASFLTGLYAGVFGAGIGVILIALLRLKHPGDTSIAFVKTQARFVEWLLVITSVITHFLHHNLIAAIWVPWAVGGLAGGYAGGLLLNRIGELPGKLQKNLLYAVFAFALIVAGSKFFIK